MKGGGANTHKTIHWLKPWSYVHLKKKNEIILQGRSRAKVEIELYHCQQQNLMLRHLKSSFMEDCKGKLKVHIVKRGEHMVIGVIQL